LEFLHPEPNYGGTAGPRTSSTTFYTAGHIIYASNSSLTLRVSDSSFNQIGSATRAFATFGSGSDYGPVTIGNNGALPSSNIFGPGSSTYTNRGSFAVGTSVTMKGNISGLKSGKVTATNQTVNVDGTNVKLNKASYTCQRGDSGGGVFTGTIPTGSNIACVGIQSSGAFLPNNTVSEYSYFSKY